MKRLIAVSSVVGSLAVHAELPAGVQVALGVMRSDLIAAVGLVVAAGFAVSLARRIWEDLRSFFGGL